MTADLYRQLQSTAGQQHPGFHVMRPRELVKHRALSDAMRVMQLGDVRRQRFRVAGDVEDVVEASGQLAGVRVHAGARRVDEDAAELVAFEVDAMQATERTHFVQGFGLSLIHI